MKFHFGYTAVRVRDMDRSIRFYTEVLGLQLDGPTYNEQTKGKYADVSSGSGHSLELNWYPDDSPVAGPYGAGDEMDHLAFFVDDYEAAMRSLTEKGHPPVLGPFESASSIWGYVEDPDGIYLEIIAKKK
jgi:lactoylglutathione lyase